MKGYMMLASLYNGKEIEKDDKEALFAQIKDLAQNFRKQSAREEMAELVGFTVNSILDQRLNWIDAIADVKRGGVADNPEFKVPYSGLVAKIQAKGATPVVSMIQNKRVVMSTKEVAIRPKVNFYELQQNPEMIMQLIEQSVVAMENAMVKDIQDSLYTTFSALSAPNYASGAGLVKATIDPQIQMIQRFGGGATILGDITQLTNFTALSAFSNRVSEKLMNEHNENRFIGTYLGANLVELENRYLDDTSLEEDNLVLRDDLVFGLSTGGSTDSRPLKVYLGSDLRAMDRTNPEDDSYEIFMKKTFGSLVVGNQKRMFIYEDTNE